MARRRRVAVLVDDSPGSMRACRYGAKHLLDKDMDVMLVTAVHDSHEDLPAASSEGERVCDHHAAQLLRCDLPPERIQKVIVVANKRRRESVADAALRGARGADHVVCGTRGVGAARSAILKAVGLGGVSHDVVRRSKVPVTVVPITAPVPEMIIVRDGTPSRQ